MKTLEKIGSGFLIGVGAITVIALLAVLSGTIIYWIWPVAIPAAFPGLVTSGVLSSKLTLFQSICLTWVFSILFKSYNSK